MTAGQVRTVLQPIVSRSAAVGLVLAIGTAIWFALVLPLWSQIETGQMEINAKRERLARYLAVASKEEHIHRALETVEREQSGSEAFAAKSEAIAAAALQERVSSFAAANKTTLRSARLLQRREEQDIVLIGMRVHLSGELRRMQSVLHTIENSVPFMFIEAVQMTGGPNRPPAGQSPELVIDAQLDIYGIFQEEPG